MKLILLGFCCIGFVVVFGKVPGLEFTEVPYPEPEIIPGTGIEQELRVSGKIECCWRPAPLAPPTHCHAPVGTQIWLHDNARDFHGYDPYVLKYANLTNAESEYFMEWKGERPHIINPYIFAELQCLKGMPVEKDYDWEIVNATDVKQDLTVYLRDYF